MTFELTTAVPVLERTPHTLNAMLRILPTAWLGANEGPNTWTPVEVVAHLIHGELTNWMPRVEHLLTHGEALAFRPFDRAAPGATGPEALPVLLDTFAALRADSLRRLSDLGLSPADLDRHGRHPDFGPVTLGQLLATWVTHDLDHVVQVARVMGQQYADAVGPWRAYLRIVREPVAR